MKKVYLVFIFFVALILGSCEKSTDGPLDFSDGSAGYEGEGFFLYARLDSGDLIHLVDDTLYLEMGNIWSFSNCALEKIQLDHTKEDSVLWISPVIKIKSDGTDCSAPYYRPDTVIKILLAENLKENLSVIKVKNDTDSLLDTILARNGTFKKDTFQIYMDSSFSDPYRYPLRTKSTKGSKEIPTILRVRDSLYSRIFYWRTMASSCTHRVDMCNSVVPDTIYPSSWNINDTNLVPVHYACADSDSTYCLNTKWENDSTDLGSLQERLDTVWYYSTYYMEKISKCATFNSFSVSSYALGYTVKFYREIMTPNSEETHCGPASREDWAIYNLSSYSLVTDTDTTFIVDSLLYQWEIAEIAPESLEVNE